MIKLLSIQLRSFSFANAVLFFIFGQMCTKIYNALCNSEFGNVSKQAEEYKERCHQIFLYATVFKPPVDSSALNDACVKSADKFVLENCQENCQENCKENFQESRQEISVSN